MRRMAVQMDVDVVAYCLMPNHFHLVLKVHAIRLSDFMQRLLASHACFINLRNERTGHLFESRFFSKLVLSEHQLANTIRYVHQNPVRAKIVLRSTDWRWSSARDAAEDAALPEEFDPWDDSVRGESLQRSEPLPMRAMEAIELEVKAKFGVSQSEMTARSKIAHLVAARREFAVEAVRNGHRLSAIARWLKVSRMSVVRYAKGGIVRIVKPDTC